IKAATPGEDEEELLNEFGEPVEEFDIMGDPSAFAEGDGGAGSSSATPPPSLADGLDPATQAIIAKSPTLQKDLVELKAKDWTIVDGPAGGGCTANRDHKIITLDSNLKGHPKETVQAIAHEVGHAQYDYKADTSSKSAYLKGTLADEGAATIKNIEVQREILANGGPDIKIAGSQANHAAYNAAYDQYRKDNNVAAAHDTIGGIFGKGERTSNTGQTYEDYYGGSYDKWKARANGK
ncbi:MAG: hypothetical protein LBE06_00120, partial [Azoarcus sp.]|nr:hypothetical protein [Azoarcus sp.]